MRNGDDVAVSGIRSMCTPSGPIITLLGNYSLVTLG